MAGSIRGAELFVSVDSKTDQPLTVQQEMEKPTPHRFSDDYCCNPYSIQL